MIQVSEKRPYFGSINESKKVRSLKPPPIQAERFLMSVRDLNQTCKKGLKQLNLHFSSIRLFCIY